MNDKSVLIWGGSTLLNTLAFIDPKFITSALGWISTALAIYYHVIKIRSERKAKK